MMAPKIIHFSGASLCCAVLATLAYRQDMSRLLRAVRLALHPENANSFGRAQSSLNE